MIGIYRLRNTCNNKFYFGQSTRINERKNDYFISNRFPNDHLKNSFEKYGKENFEFKLMFECPEEMLDVCEELLIYLMDTQNREKGYNKESGGNLNKHHSPESRKKMSENHADFSGENHPNYGKKLPTLSKKMSGKGNPNFGIGDSGISYVHKSKSNRYAQGYIWVYKKIINGVQYRKRSVNLRKLEKNVLNDNQEWIILDEDKAIKSYKESDKNNQR